jgi:hypothetical protein
LSSENKVIKDDNHLILILIYDIFAEIFMDVEIKVDGQQLHKHQQNKQSPLTSSH